MIEIERTYLVKQIPGGLDLYPHERIEQGYLSEPPSPLRIRQKGLKFELTKKFPTGSQGRSTNDEINIALREEEFRKLWPLTIKSLEKTRHFIPLESGLTAELDVFHGPLEGLSFVEVEFEDVNQMKKFSPPSWFGRDVTDAEFSANVFLAGKSYREVRKLIESVISL